MSDFLRRNGISYPIFQAPMAGGPTTPELVAAVCNAGGLGFIAAAYLSAEQIEAFSREVRARTTRPFGINLFAPVEPSPLPQDAQPALEAVAGYHHELGLSAPTIPARGIIPFNEQF